MLELGKSKVFIREFFTKHEKKNSLKFRNFNSDPSIDGDTPFKSCQSENEIFCQEISNEPKSSVTYDIKKQLHYDTWREVEKMLEMNVKGAGNTFNVVNFYTISAILFVHLLFRTFY